MIYIVISSIIEHIIQYYLKEFVNFINTGVLKHYCAFVI